MFHGTYAFQLHKYFIVMKVCWMSILIEEKCIHSPRHRLENPSLQSNDLDFNVFMGEAFIDIPFQI